MTDDWAPPGGEPIGLPTSADRPLGPGWWQASDGRFYPPHLATPPAPGGPPVHPAAPTWGALPSPGPISPPTSPGVAPSGALAEAAAAPEPRPPTARQAWWVAPVVGVVVLAVLAPLTYHFVKSRLEQAEDETAIDHPAPDYPVTPSPTTPVEKPATIGGLMIFEDEFDDPGSGWGAESSADGDRYEYVDGGLAVTPANGFAEHQVPFRSVAGAVEVEATIVPPSSATSWSGIGCHYRAGIDSSPSSSILFHQFADGGYSVIHGKPDGSSESLARGVSFPLTGPTRLSLLCDDGDAATDGRAAGQIRVFRDGVQIAGQPVPLEFAASGRWLASIHASTPDSLPHRFERMSVRDPSVADVARPPIALGAGEVVASESLAGDDHAWGTDLPVTSKVAAGTSPEGVMLVSTSVNRAGIFGSLRLPDRPVEVSATVEVLDGSSPGTGAGVGCAMFDGVDQVSYALNIGPEGTWILDRAEVWAGVTTHFIVRLGGNAEAHTGPALVRVACIPGTTSSGNDYLRLVGALGDRVVVDVVDTIPESDDRWYPLLTVSRTRAGSVRGRFTTFEARLVG